MFSYEAQLRQACEEIQQAARVYRAGGDWTRYTRRAYGRLMLLVLDVRTPRHVDITAGLLLGVLTERLA